MSFADSWARLGRDLRMLAGRTPAAALSRHPLSRHVSLPRDPTLGRPMRIAQAERETPDSVTLVLVDPLGAPVGFEPGQFFTLLVDVGGQVLRRAYSATSAPGEHGGGVRLTVKRIPGGRASARLVESAAAGQIVQVLGPSGEFVPAAASAPRHLALVAGGSGITPMMSIARTLLAREPATRLSLLYGNRGLADVIYREELARLAAEHGERLRVRHVLSDPPEGWSGGRGLLTPDISRTELTPLLPADEVFLCGPQPMMEAVRAALAGLGFPRERLREERFTQPHLRAESAPVTVPQALRVRGAGAEWAAIQAPGRTLLEAGLAAGAPLPFSCTVGGCGSCRVRLVEGEVAMEEPNCLSDDERAAGDVLTCVGRARTPVVLQLPGGDDS